MREALLIRVKGIVQGVGFRPFVYRLAKRYLIDGWVLNAADGVTIHAEGEAKLLDEFVIELSENAPAASQVDEVSLEEVPLEGFDSFEIRFSDQGTVEETTLVSPDLATCEDCVRELFNPNDRRYRYPFINCTNCGPRFTIIEELPYDRPRTSMAPFEMCDRCAAEYADPADRRFHAQPDACFDCGPAISFALTRQTKESACYAAKQVPSGTASQGMPSCGFAAERSEASPFGGKPSSPTEVGFLGLSPQSDAPCEASLSEPILRDIQFRYAKNREESDAILAEAVELLMAGKTLAVKGLGGFHLACNANDPQAVARLRERKHRDGKAFAVMMADTSSARELCEVDDAEERLLTGAQRPIVLLRKRAGAPLAPGVADRLPELGVMLPYTPVQHLLMHDFAEAWRAAGGKGAPMLVMTSGNVHDEPIVTSDEEAVEKLSGIADAILGNNRPILTRFDDSVVRVLQLGGAEGEGGAAHGKDAPTAQAIQFLRRARGYAPVPLQVGAAGCEADHPVLFATGPEQKVTFTLLRGEQAFVSQHIGDVEDVATYDAWLAAKQRFEELFDARPQALACDLHPEYLTSKWAHEQPLPLTEVQHHHAHVVSVLAEHQLEGPVCGIAFDGTGYGVDGAIWGGEALLANRSAFERFANFAYVPMPGGAAAVKHPLRMAYGALWAFDLLDHPGAAKALAPLGDQAAVCEAMVEQGLNTPMTSSVGRLFDAASALLGVCVEPTYEGEAAILLEAAIGEMAEGDEHSEHGNESKDGALSQHEAANPQATPEPSAPETQDEEPAEGAQPRTPAPPASRYAIEVIKNTATDASTAEDTSVVLLDAAPTFASLLDDQAAGVPVPLIARRFHDAFVEAIVTTAELVRSLYGIEVVALSGGVFMNRYLTEHAVPALEERGFTVAINRDLPPNDGCISLGQAVVAWAKTAGA